MVSSETGILPSQRQVVTDVAGRMNSGQAPASAGDVIAISERCVTAKGGVDPFAAANLASFGKFLHYLGPARSCAAIGEDGRTSCVGEWTREGRMIHMCVGHDDMRDVLLGANCLQYSVQMGHAFRAWVNHSEIGGAQKVGVGAAIGHGRGIGGHDTAQARFQRFGHANRGIKVIWRQHGFTFRWGWAVGTVVSMFFAWLKRYMPRGIYARAALILLLPVVIIQLVVTVLFAQRHFEGVTHQMTDTMLREFRLVLEVIDDTALPADVMEAVQERLGPLKITVLTVPDDEIPQANRMVWYDYSGRVIVQRFKEMLPGFRAMDLTNNRAVRIFVEASNGTFELRFDRRRISASNPHQLFVYTIFFGIVMTVIAFIYLRNQLRPITRLAHVAEAFGRGRHLPYAPAGADEVRSAGTAFLDMRARIERQIEQRTLMLSGVSHDLRTPLTRLRLGLSMLDEDDAALLTEDVDDMQRMLDEFLNFAKGSAEGEPEEVDPHDMVAEIVEQAQRAGRNVILLDPEGDGSGMVTLRKVAIRRAVDNLISNAVRYGARAEVSVLFTEKTLRIRVEDDGPGIPENRRDEATRAFTRLDPARNQDRGGGVGLGLAIATDIARAHGGTLRLGESTRMSGLRADIVIAR